MITFIHDDKSLSLGPKAIFTNDPLLNDAKEDANEGDNEIKSNLLDVDGVLHLLFESPSIVAMQNRIMDEGRFPSILYLLKLCTLIVCIINT